MTWFALLTPIALSAVGGWLLAGMKVNPVHAGLALAVVSVLLTFVLLRMRYTLFEIGPFMLLPQMASFVLALFAIITVMRWVSNSRT